MQIDDLEFSICQYLDGNLPDAERAALELRLGSDPEMQGMLREYRRLDAALKAMPLPVVKWDQFAASISAAVDAQDERGRQSYRMPFWMRVAVPLALAASVVIAVIGIQVYRNHSSGQTAKLVQQTPQRPEVPPAQGPEVPPADVVSSVAVLAPKWEKSAGPTICEVSIGPSEAVKDEPVIVQYSGDVVSRPSSITIASGVAPMHHEEIESQLFDME